MSSFVVLLAVSFVVSSQEERVDQMLAQQDHPSIIISRASILHETRQHTKKPETIVSVSGSLLDGIGQWLDMQLQPLTRHLQSYIRDSADLVTWWRQLENLPPSVCIFTMDAVAMYSNIDPGSLPEYTPQLSYQ
jgi:hypothetical protein